SRGSALAGFIGLARSSGLAGGADPACPLAVAAGTDLACPLAVAAGTDLACPLAVAAGTDLACPLAVAAGADPAGGADRAQAGSGGSTGRAGLVYPGIHLSTSARKGTSHPSWQSTPRPAASTRWMST